MIADVRFPKSRTTPIDTARAGGIGFQRENRQDDRVESTDDRRTPRSFSSG